MFNSICDYRLIFVILHRRYKPCFAGTGAVAVESSGHSPAVNSIIVDTASYLINSLMLSAGYTILFSGNRFIKQSVILCAGNDFPTTGSIVALHQIKTYCWHIFFPLVETAKTSGVVISVAKMQMRLAVWHSQIHSAVCMRLFHLPSTGFSLVW